MLYIINSMKKGFTIIELLVIISIIGLISSVALANLQGSRDKAKTAAAQIFRSNVNGLLGAQTAAAWNFNEGTLGGVVTTVPDSSGSNLTGTVVVPPGGSATYTEGVNNIGNGVLLTGGAHIYGTGISSSAGKPVTVTAWINPIMSIANVRRIFEVGVDACSSFRVGIDSANVMIGNNSDQVATEDEGGDDDSALASPENLLAAAGEPVILNQVRINNSKWQFLAVSFDPSGDARTYIDGTLVATVSGLPTTECLPVDSANWSIGGIAPGAGPEYTYFNGKIDDVTVYDGSLTPATVSKLYRDGLDKYTAAAASATFGN